MKKLPDFIPFFGMVNDFLNIYLAGTSSAKTVKAYKDALTVFRRYLCDVLGLSLRKFAFPDCTFDLALDFRNWLIDESGCLAATANHRLAALKSYVRYAASKDVALEQTRAAVDQVPFLRNPVKMRPIIAEEDALRAFLNAPKNTPLGRRDAVILTLLFDAALRAEELISLRLCDICLDTETPHLLIHGKGSKERIVTIADASARLIRDFISEVHDGHSDADLLIYTTQHGRRNRMSERNLERIVAKYAAIARETHPSIPKQCSPHTLRRSRATLLYQSGTPIELIATFLGHSSIQTTMDHYAVPSLEQKKEVSEKGAVVLKKDEEPEWPEDNDEFARICGLR